MTDTPSLRAVDETAEVFANDGLIRQQVPNGIRDNARENRKGKAYKEHLQTSHLLSGGKPKKSIALTRFLCYI